MSKVEHWTLRAGKLSKIAEWTYVSPFKHEEPIKIEVKYGHNAEMGAYFSATVWGLAATSLEWYSTNIESLRKTVETELAVIVGASNGAIWEDYLEVVVSGHAGHFKESNSRTMEVSYRPIKRGINPLLPGQVFQLSNTGHAYKFPSPKNANEVDPDVSKDPNAPLHERINERQLDSSYSYIPDTPENRAGLARITDGMLTLQGRLSYFLEQGQAAAFISSVNNGANALALKEERTHSSAPKI